MSTTFKLRRDTTANIATAIGAQGEVFVDTTKNTLVVNDGVTAGGFPLAKAGQNSDITSLSAVTGVTAANGDNSTKLATTAFVQNNFPSFTPPVRQTVLQGVLNSSGYANMLSAGTGLNLNLAATATPMVTTFAQGLANLQSTLSADATNIISSGLAANALTFIAQDYVSGASVTWSGTLAPPQYGYTYNQSAQSVLQFSGSAGATTFLDDFGNTWTAQGSAKVQTNQFKFGTGALGGGGTSNALNGSTDYIKSTGFTSLGGGGLSMRCWVYSTNAASSTAQSVFYFGNSSGFGILCWVISGKIQYNLSSTGTSWDISNAATGTNTISSNAWNFIEITYDPVAGKYFGFVNGVLDFSVTSTSKICAVSTACVGAGLSGGTTAAWFVNGYVDKFEFLPYCQHPAGTTYSVPSAAPNVTTQGYSSDWFNTSNYTMYQVSGASATSGANPTFTVKNRVYVGESVAGASTVSSVTNYAIQGKYDSGLFSVNALTTYAKSHNIGVGGSTLYVSVSDSSSGANERPVNDRQYDGTNTYGHIRSIADRNTNSVAIGTYVSFSAGPSFSGMLSGFYRFLCNRRF